MDYDNSALVLILKNAGSSCNIGCKYCAEARKQIPFLDNNNTITVSDIQKLIEKTRNITHLMVLFHGGEPLLLNQEYYSKIMDVWSHARPDVYFGMQTNGTLIDEDWIDLFLKYQNLLGISVSIDGDIIANQYRKNKNGDAAYAKIISGIRLLEKNNLKTGIISTLTKAAVGRERELFDLLSEFNNLRFVKLNFCYDMWQDGSRPEWAITTKDYLQYVKTFFNILIRESAFERLNVEPIVSIIRKLMNLPSDYCNFNNRKCHYFLSVYPGGRMIACDNFDFTDGEYECLHNVEEDPRVKKSEKMTELFCDFDMLLEQCRQCDYYAICTGGCMAVRHRFKKYGRQGEYEQYCKDTKLLIDHIRKYINKVRLS